MNSPTWTAAVSLFNGGSYLASHELFEELWEEHEGGDAEFYKGLIQAALCLHQFQDANLDGARKLYRGHRRCLAGFLPRHAGIDVERLLTDMQETLGPVLRARPGESVPFVEASAPLLHAAADAS